MKKADALPSRVGTHNTIEYSFSGVGKKRWIAETKEKCMQLLEKLGTNGWEVSVLFCNDDLMTKLNKKYRGKDGTTDVLSFRQDDNHGFPPTPGCPHVAGDVVISIDTLERNAETMKIDLKTELLRLLIHAFLHLNGMDHHGKNSPMIELQEKLLIELEEGNS